MDFDGAMGMLTGVALAGLMACGTPLLAQTAAAKATVPDAQVESAVLKALAGAPDLANQSIATTTVYGVVTLSGTVQTEAQRTEAENITARTPGVKKVVDEITLSGENASQASPNTDSAAAPDGQPSPDGEASNPDLQSDGTTGPQEQPEQPALEPDQAPNQASGPAYGAGAPEYRQPYTPQQPNSYPQQQGAPGQPPPPGQPGNGQFSSPPGYAQPNYQEQQSSQGYYGAPAYAGQQAGQMATIPTGALIRIRINQTLDSARTQPGQRFDGIVVNDVVADGAVAIPRGASVQGIVINAKKSGALAGRGELSLQLNQLTLGGNTYSIASDIWDHNGADKAVQSVNNTAIGGGIGALLGAVAGGGPGAAIGAGLGGALGLGASAASHSGQVYVPSEGLLTFHLSQPVTVSTVSQQEMDRLAQAAGPTSGRPGLRRRYPYPYYGPMMYRPYPYPYGYPYGYPYPY